MLLLALSPLLLITALLVRADGGPAIFSQTRIGYREAPFQIYKFRTMIVDADRYLDASGMPTRSRLTRLGMVLRKSSIDELPQLFNILRGDMALIGPRPILPHMLPYMTSAERRRFTIHPGVTGWAQVKGRNFIPWSRRFELDAEYVDEASPWLDMKILFHTALRVVSSGDVAMDRNADVVDDITTRAKTS